MIVLLGGLLVFLAMRVPVAYALGLSALSYFTFYRPELLPVLPQRLLAGMDTYELIALPLFILMGQLMNVSGITSLLINFCLLFVGRIPGALGLVNVTASMLFGGISGSSASDTASIGSVLIPEMESRGYPKSFAAGITVASSTMGMIIPPSIPIVIYAVTAQESVGRLFLGGIIPGILVGVLQLLFVYLISKKRKFPTSQIKLSARDIGLSLLVLPMPIVVVGSVVGGIATPTESAAIGLVYAAVLGCVLRLISTKVYGETSNFTLANIHEATRSSILTSAKIMMIIAMSKVFIWVLAYERVPENVASGLIGAGFSPTILMLLIAGFVLLAGTFIDVSPAILLLTPVFLPAVQQAGISPVLFGVVLVSALAVGACTPPVGNCLNVCSAVCGLKIGEIFRGAFVFLLANVIALVLTILFPQTVLWIPSVLMP